MTPSSAAILTDPAEAGAHARALGLSGARAEALDRQLRALMSEPDEMPSVRPGALEGLVRFLVATPGASHPGLSLDASGNVVASWSPRPRARLSLTFEGPSEACWIASDRSGGVRCSGVLSPFGAEGLGDGLPEWLGTAPAA